MSQFTLYLERELENEFSRKLPPGKYCMCCLRRNIPYINLGSCVHTSFIDYISKFKVEYTEMFVCYNCHAMLKKFDVFKQKVEENFSILNNQNIDIEGKRIYNLGTSSIKIVDSTIPDPSPKVKHEDSIELDTYFVVKVEREIEYDDPNQEREIEHKVIEVKEKEVEPKQVKTKNTALARKGRVKKESKKPKREKKYEAFEDKYKGIIKMITLNEEELQLLRDKERSKPSYLKLPFKCNDCIIGFDHEIRLKSHIDQRHTKKKGVNIVCGLCKTISKSETSFIAHTKRHYIEYECCVCKKRAKDPFTIQDHYNKTHGTIDINYKCDQCDYVTQSRRQYRYHKQKHKPRAECSLCEKSFITNTTLQDHMFMVHKLSNRKFDCSICDKSYMSNSGLIMHMRSSHSNINENAYCEPCKKHFKCARNLAHHIKTHSSHAEHRYICDECGIKFRNKSSLIQHMEFIHLKVNQAQCAKCKKICRNPRDLKKHVRYVHDKVRPPRNKICEQCGRGFMTLQILESHIRTHTGERPYKCSHCSATFAHSGALYTHNKLLHSNT